MVVRQCRSVVMLVVVRRVVLILMVVVVVVTVVTGWIMLREVHSRLVVIIMVRERENGVKYYLCKTN